MRNNIIEIEDVEILQFATKPEKRKIKNFSGTVNAGNKNGERYFNIVLNDDFAEQLKADGWNVKRYEPTNTDIQPYYYLELKVSYAIERLAPDIYIVNTPSGKPIKLSERTVGRLDKLTITHADVRIRGREWEPGRIKAYCAALYVETERNRFDIKYNIGMEDDEDYIDDDDM